MELDKKGIKNLKEVVVFLALTANATDVSTKDGLQPTDFGNYMGAIGTLPAALADLDEVPAEIKDLDEAEKAEILAELKTKLTLEDKVLEGLIEEGLTIAAGLWGLVEKIREARK